MISSKKLIKMARKWRKLAAISRKRITFPRTMVGSASKVDKGHFVLYTSDQKRFVIPLAYLDNGMLRELLKIAGEEFGLSSQGPIRLPCDAVFMEYVLSLVRKHAAEDLQKALLMSITTGLCFSSSCLQQGESNQQLLVCSC